jgi:hypothetical protein
MDEVRERATWLARTLADAGVAVEWEPVTGPYPSGLFEFNRQGRQPLRVRALHTGDVFQLTALDVDDTPPAGRLEFVNASNENLRLTRAYWNEATGRWDVSAGIYLPGQPVAPDAVYLLLDLMSSHRDLLNEPAAAITYVAPTEPAADLMPSVAKALDAVGWPNFPENDGITVELVLDEGFRTVVEWYVERGMLVVRAVPWGITGLSADEPVYRALTTLNGRLDVGGVGMWVDQGAPCGWVAHPVDAFTVSSESATWNTVHAATYAMHATRAAMAASNPPMG